MPSIIERCSDIWNTFTHSEAKIPSRVDIPSGHVVDGGDLGTNFKPNEHYFQVRINEMYLTYGRQFWTDFDPMVFVISEFDYNKEKQAVPFIVGPMMMEKHGKIEKDDKKMPKGMIFSDTRVAGLHPYSGGRLILSVVLYQAQRGNYAKEILRLVENAANVLDFSTALSTYTKIANVVLDGVEALFGLGNLNPVMGFRKECDPDANDKLTPSYFALVNKPEDQLDIDQLWVSNNRLLYGESKEKAKPFRSADFVLYSIAQTSARSDLTTLPFYPLWERVIEEATGPTEENWKSAKSNMLSLFQTMMLSPDLTESHALKLTEEYRTRMKLVRDHALRTVAMGDKKKPKPVELDTVRQKSIEILDL
jgi:hypothetical protein